MLKRLPLPVLPLLAILVLLGIYWLYWSTLADRLKDGVVRWAEQQAGDGIEVTWDGLRVRGFPTRVRLEFDNPRYAAVAAEAPWSWSAPELHAHVLPYRFDHIILNAKSPMTVTRRDGNVEETWEIASGSAAASYVMEDGDPARLAIDLEEVDAKRIDMPGAFTAERMQLHARRTDEAPGSVDLAMRASKVVLGEGTVPGLAALLGPEIAHFGVQSRVTAGAGDEVFDDIALAQLEGGRVAVSQGVLVWGDVEASVSGSTDISPEGRATGRFDTRIEGQDELVDAMVREGVVDRDAGDALRTAFAILALTGGDSEGALRVPLILRDNEIFLGPVNVGRID